MTDALPARDAALTSLEVDWEFRPDMVLGANFDGAFASHSDSLGGKAELQVMW